MSSVKKSSKRFFLTMVLLGFFALMTAQTPHASASECRVSEVPSANLTPHQPLGLMLAEEKSSIDKSKRIMLVGAGCIGIFGTILILFGYFQLNHATRGFYSGRLQTLALGLIVILLGFAFWLAQQFGA